MFISVSIPQNQSFGPIFPLKLNSNLSSDILVSTRYKECLEWLNSAIQLENKPIQHFKWDSWNFWFLIWIGCDEGPALWRSRYTVWMDA